MKVVYGKLDPITSVFVEKEIGAPIDSKTGKAGNWETKIFTKAEETVDLFYKFRYEAGCNHFQLEIIEEAAQGKKQSHLLFPLNELPYNLPTTKILSFKNYFIPDTSSSVIHVFPTTKVSFYLKAKKKLGMDNPFSNISTLHTILQKVPGRVDVFHKHHH